MDKLFKGTLDRGGMALPLDPLEGGWGGGGALGQRGAAQTIVADPAGPRGWGARAEPATPGNSGFIYASSPLWRPTSPVVSMLTPFVPPACALTTLLRSLAEAGPPV